MLFITQSSDESDDCRCGPIMAAVWCWFPVLSSNHGNHQAACQGDAEADGEVYWGHEGVTALMSCVIDEDDWCDDVHAC